MLPISPPDLLTQLSKTPFTKLSRFPMLPNLASTLLYRAVPSTMMRFFEALRKSPDCQAIRPDIAGIMGAFGAALIARERYRKVKKPPCFPLSRSIACSTLPPWPNCHGCTNNCRLTINKFSGGRQLYLRQPL